MVSFKLMWTLLFLLCWWATFNAEFLCSVCLTRIQYPQSNRGSRTDRGKWRWSLGLFDGEWSFSLICFWWNWGIWGVTQLLSFISGFMLAALLFWTVSGVMTFLPTTWWSGLQRRRGYGRLTTNRLILIVPCARHADGSLVLLDCWLHVSFLPCTSSLKAEAKGIASIFESSKRN